MNKDIRPSRKEMKRDRSLRSRASYREQKAASRARSATNRDWDHIFVEYGVPGPADLRKVIDDLIFRFRDGGIPASDYAASIFDPAVDDLTKLPIGLLDHKEEALPPEFLPQTKEELLAHCKRMIIRNVNEELVEAVVAGWPGRGSPEGKLQGHVADLWRLRHLRPDLYRFILCGQHDEVLLRLRDGLPGNFTLDDLVRMLVRHGLLWCTNDIQLILARNALGEKNPFGVLLSSDYKKLEPTRIVNNLRPHFLLLRLVLDLYVTEAAAANGKKVSEVPDEPIARLLKIRINRHAATNGIDLMALRPKLDTVIPHLEKLLKKSGTRLRRELEKPVSANELEKHFHGIWFSGLSNVQASAVPLLRYLQAEAELEGMIRDLIPAEGNRIKAREGVALPAFAESRLRDGWRGRVKDLLFLYRRELLDDAGPGERQEGAVRSKNAGWDAILQAIKFLQEQGERLISDYEGDENSPRRTYYLLDIIPEARLARQFCMAMWAKKWGWAAVARIKQPPRVAR